VGIVLVLAYATFVITIAMCETKYIDILKNFNNYIKVKSKQVSLKTSYKMLNNNLSYIKNDMLKLLRVPEFLTQIYAPVVLIQITGVIGGIMLVGRILESDEALQLVVETMKFNAQGFRNIAYINNYSNII
ncbi:MAG: hypothetical protein R3Y54_12170, partial [Eubacteriales bacterium]